jgi:choline kinase
MSTSRTIIINAAGIGSRLGMNIPKTLISINGRPVIFWILNALKKERNIKIVVGYKASEIIKFVSQIRNDIIFVNNKNFDKTGTSASFLLACRNESCKEVISIDGDLIFSKNGIQKMLSSKETFIAVTKPRTDNAIFVKEKKKFSKIYYNGFTKLKTRFEWSGIFKIKLNKLNINDKSFHIYEMLKKVKSEFKIYQINSMDFDTPHDLTKLKKEFRKIYY